MKLCVEVMYKESIHKKHKKTNMLQSSTAEAKQRGTDISECKNERSDDREVERQNH